MVRIYAHRGASAELPENTLAAFRRALALGADAIETDAHLTRDGHVVLSHDPTGARMAGVSRAIADCTLEELSSWNVGHGLRMPTLAEALVEFPDTSFNVDVKVRTPQMIAAVMEVIACKKAQQRVLLASFDSGALRAIRAAGYSGQTGMGRTEIARLALTPRLLLGGLPVKGHRAQVPVAAFGIELASRGFIERCHAKKIAVDFWTIDDPIQARELVELGADGIVTNDVAAVVAAIGKRPGERL